MICEKNLEGIVAKHRASPYSPSAKWIKIKNPAYPQSERRHELFEKVDSHVILCHLTPVLKYPRVLP
jgi:ATP-dependent DNA ligase